MGFLIEPSMGLTLRVFVAIVLVKSCPPNLSCSAYLDHVKAAFSSRRRQRFSSACNAPTNGDPVSRDSDLERINRIKALETEMTVIRLRLEHTEYENECLKAQKTKRRKPNSKPNNTTESMTKPLFGKASRKLTLLDIDKRSPVGVTGSETVSDEPIFVAADILSHVRCVCSGAMITSQAHFALAIPEQFVHSAIYILQLTRSVLANQANIVLTQHLHTHSSNLPIHRVLTITSWTVTTIFELLDNVSTKEHDLSPTHARLLDESMNLINQLIQLCFLCVLNYSSRLHEIPFDQTSSNSAHVNEDICAHISSFLRALCQAPKPSVLVTYITFHCIDHLLRICTWAENPEVQMDQPLLRFCDSESTETIYDLLKVHMGNVTVRKECILRLCDTLNDTQSISLSVPARFDFPRPSSARIIEAIRMKASSVARSVYNHKHVDKVCGPYYANRILSSVLHLI